MSLVLKLNQMCKKIKFFDISAVKKKQSSDKTTNNKKLFLTNIILIIKFNKIKNQVFIIKLKNKNIYFSVQIIISQ